MLFYFSYSSTFEEIKKSKTITYLNLLNVGKPDPKQTQELSRSPEPRKNAANESNSEVMVPVRFKVPEKTSKSETNIHTALKYHLIKHQFNESQRSQFNLPEPNLVKINDDKFLVMTVLRKGSKAPSVCFYTLEETEGLSCEPFKEVPGVDLLLDIDTSSADAPKLRFLTNKQSFERSQAHQSSDAATDRLISPPIIVEIDYNQLMNSDDRDFTVKYLATDSYSMCFFRCQSHLYPFVQAVTTNSSLLLRFYGSDSLHSSAIVL